MRSQNVANWMQFKWKQIWKKKLLSFILSTTKSTHFHGTQQSDSIAERTQSRSGLRVRQSGECKQGERSLAHCTHVVFNSHTSAHLGWISNGRAAWVSTATRANVKMISIYSRSLLPYFIFLHLFHHFFAQQSAEIRIVSILRTLIY